MVHTPPTTACPALYLLFNSISCIVSTIFKSLCVVSHLLVLQDGYVSLDLSSACGG
jgi:hypothetical protein